MPARAVPVTLKRHHAAEKPNRHLSLRDSADKSLRRTWPNPTSRWFISGWSSRGSQDCRLSLPDTEDQIASARRNGTRVAHRVSSGVLVGGLCQPSLFVILWTCTSTPMPAFLRKHMGTLSRSSGPHLQLPCHLQCEESHLRAHTREGAEFIHRFWDVAVKLVVQLLCRLSDVPVDGSEDGTVASGNGRAHWVLRRQKPTLQIASAIALSSALRIASTDKVPPTAARSLATAASVTSSFV